MSVEPHVLHRVRVSREDFGNGVNLGGIAEVAFRPMLLG